MRQCLLLATIFISSLALGQDEGILNRLLAPGPLIEGHKELEGKDCLKCHDAGKGVPNTKCLECHTEIAKDVTAGRGFHGLTSASCIKCHGDHKGRTFDSTKVDAASFDHSKTGYTLEGKHKDIKCSECHIEKRKSNPKATRYIGKTTTCVSCHKKDDIHFFSGKFANKDCNACHGLKSFKTDIRFDHTRDTQFKLEGKHDQLKCSECHVKDKNPKKAQYEWPHLAQRQCLNCHDDYHKNNLSPRFRTGKCLECHTQTDWKMTSFNHKSTGYPLRGRHAELKCAECHKSGSATTMARRNWTGLKGDCLSCHKDEHRFGSFKSARITKPNQCLSCHDESRWKNIHDFNHNSQTRFALEGKHLPLECSDCHIPGEKSKAPSARKTAGIYHWNELPQKSCNLCHANPHLKTFKPELLKKRCTECHVADGWKVSSKRSQFDHSKTRFEISGAHKELACSACHVVGREQVYKFAGVDKGFCNDCHKTPHGEQFSASVNQQSCTTCHSTKNWQERVDFDHSKTRFELKNAHSKLKCSECHRPTEEHFSAPPQRAMSRFLFRNLESESCSTCHHDYHKGQLGKQCSICHNDTSWKKYSFDHNTQSRFSLKGQHMTLKCGECHKASKTESTSYKSESRPLFLFRPLATECVSCHKDPHGNNFGRVCSECHVEKGWKTTKDFHKDFALSGVHYTLECAECHKNSRRLAGASENCQLCHQKDDIHFGTLPNCGSCHKQQFWENPDFRHSRTSFPLRGVHRTLECSSCHVRGIYQGTQNKCVSCHLAAAQRASAHPNPLPSFEDCTRCHNQFSF